MTEIFEFTDAYDLNRSSSWVHGVWYNVKTKEALFDLNDVYYKYSNVPKYDVEHLVKSSSIGGQYNQYFSQVYGPADRLNGRPTVVAAPTVVTAPTIAEKAQNSWATSPVTNEFGETTQSVTPELVTTMPGHEYEVEKVYNVTIKWRGEEKVSQTTATSIGEAVRLTEALGVLLGEDFEVTEVALLG